MPVHELAVLVVLVGHLGKGHRNPGTPNLAGIQMRGTNIPVYTYSSIMFVSSNTAS